METAYYNVIIRSAYIGESQEPCLRLFRCTAHEVMLLAEEIIWNHSGYMMENYRYGEDDEE